VISPRLSLASLVVFFAVASGAGAARQSAQTPPEPIIGQAGKDVVWVPTPPELVEKMLDLAEVTPKDFVMDLGSGDGRNIIAAAKRGARALGVEFNPDLVEFSRKRAIEAGVAGKASFVQGDMYAADISRATVLALFLKPENLDRMVDKFLAMKPGTRIVLNTFPITDWDPDATAELEPNCHAWCTAMLMIVPARVGGTWRTGSSQLTLKQYFQVVRGTLGSTQVSGKLRGSQITLEAGDAKYIGEVKGDRIEGHAMTAGKKTRWTATRTPG
jgi:SAM-dependent methyltransferase